MTEAGPGAAVVAAAAAADEFVVVVDAVVAVAVVAAAAPVAAAADPSLAAEGLKPAVGLERVVDPSYTKEHTPKQSNAELLFMQKQPVLRTVQSSFMLFVEDRKAKELFT